MNHDVLGAFVKQLKKDQAYPFVQSDRKRQAQILKELRGEKFWDT